MTGYEEVFQIMTVTQCFKIYMQVQESIVQVVRPTLLFFYFFYFLLRCRVVIKWHIKLCATGKKPLNFDVVVYHINILKKPVLLYLHCGPHVDYGPDFEKPCRRLSLTLLNLKTQTVELIKHSSVQKLFVKIW